MSLASGCFRQRLMAPILRMRPPEALTRTSSSGSALTAQVSWARRQGSLSTQAGARPPEPRLPPGHPGVR